MVITSHYKVLTEVKKLNKEEEAKELAREFQHQFNEGENNISFKDAYEMAYNEILYKLQY
tara:strand:- start:41 stop:220 length:180 start_codon:yes stop_codon:yes gene_type:complete